MRTPLRNKLLCLLLLSLGIACAGKPAQYPLNPLALQVLRFRQGHKGLTHARKVYNDAGGYSWEILEHDLADQKVRNELRSLNFGCSVNGHLYRVAQDSDALIRETYEQSCFLFICGPRKEVVLDLIQATPPDRLINAGTVCFSLEHYKFDSPGKLGGGNQ